MDDSHPLQWSDMQACEAVGVAEAERTLCLQLLLQHELQKVRHRHSCTATAVPLGCRYSHNVWGCSPWASMGAPHAEPLAVLQNTQLGAQAALYYAL